MRIISDFHDYYDQAQGEGQDLSLVYFRKQEKFDPALAAQGGGLPLSRTLRELQSLALSSTPSGFDLKSPDGRGGVLEVRFTLLVFAGTLYPLAKLTRWQRNALSPDAATYAASYADLKSRLSRWDEGADLDKRDQKPKHRMWGESPRVADYFHRRGSQIMREACLAGEIPCASWEGPSGILTLNPKLSDLHMFNVLHPYQAFQELSMFLGNIAAPERAIPQPPDRDKVPQHGFDNWSFRRRPAG